jgi:hypothetical protein
LRQHTLGVGSFRNAFLIDGLNRVTEFGLNGQTTLVMLEIPSAIPDRTNIYEANLKLVLGPRRHPHHGGRSGSSSAGK